jgi:phage terminase small subunit
METTRARAMTAKQRRFVDAYLGETMGNATEAARRAGYAHANKQAAEVMAKPAVRAAIEAEQADLRAKAILTREEILTGLSSIARGEGDEPHVLQSGETVYAPPKFSDRRGALMDAAKLQGLLVDKVEVKVTDSIRAQLRELQEKMPEEAFEALLVALAGDGEA